LELHQKVQLFFARTFVTPPPHRPEYVNLAGFFLKGMMGGNEDCAAAVDVNASQPIRKIFLSGKENPAASLSFPGQVTFGQKTNVKNGN
jgi:hypothetical protein